MVDNKKPIQKKPSVKKPIGKMVAAVGLTIKGNFFEAGEIVTVEIPEWMIEQKLVIEENK